MTRKKKPTYRYESCQLLNVVDGDTVVVSIDVGFDFKTVQRLRLLDCYMPELDTPAGKSAKEQLSLLLAGSSGLVVETTKKDRYGRWLARVWRPEQGDAPHIGRQMKDWLEAWELAPESQRPWFTPPVATNQQEASK